jgi:hypothetical protein
MADRVFKVAGDWALASDGIQWMLMRRRPNSFTGWKPVSFVRSTKDILARCCTEKGVDEAISRQLLEGLPDSFDQWKSLLALPERPTGADQTDSEVA